MFFQWFGRGIRRGLAVAGRSSHSSGGGQGVGGHGQALVPGTIGRVHLGGGGTARGGRAIPCGVRTESVTPAAAVLGAVEVLTLIQEHLLDAGGSTC